MVKMYVYLPLLFDIFEACSILLLYYRYILWFLAYVSKYVNVTTYTLKTGVEVPPETSH
jgi:hypothetical protein